MSKVTMPEPFGWLLDCLPGGGLAFQRERPSEMQSLVNSTCAVFTTSQAEAYAAAKVREALEQAANAVADPVYIEAAIENFAWVSHDNYVRAHDLLRDAQKAIRALIPTDPRPGQP